MKKKQILKLCICASVVTLFITISLCYIITTTHHINRIFSELELIQEQRLENLEKDVMKLDKKVESLEKKLEKGN